MKAAKLNKDGFTMISVNGEYEDVKHFLRKECLNIRRSQRVLNDLPADKYSVEHIYKIVSVSVDQVYKMSIRQMIKELNRVGEYKFILTKGEPETSPGTGMQKTINNALGNMYFYNKNEGLNNDQINEVLDNGLRFCAL